WAAVYIETNRSINLSEAERDTVASTLRLAEQLGGEAITLPGREVAEELVCHAIAIRKTRARLRTSSTWSSTTLTPS
ncbi:hypothetical protein ACCS72_39035, partial [Rhizobium ruizarguesonis]